ncbi:MAG TPA: hypothetical protein P5225_01830 [Candidatus Paceibacterota bacterium]|nr:hypothetical protein [Candidatus Paceibacterota bacterium]
MKRRSFLLFLSLFIILSLILIDNAIAVCPVCTLAVGAGLGLSRWLKIDDLVSGLWVGALIVSLTFWTDDFLKKKKINFQFSHLIILVIYLLLVILPLYFSGIIGHPLNTILGIDKLIFGTFLGILLFYLAVYLNDYLKSKNNNRVYFPYQKVIIPVAILLVTSLISYFLLK